MLGLLVAGCGAQVSGAPASKTPAPAVADSRQVQMCTILTGAELTTLGVRLDTRRKFNKMGVVGCRWLGKPFTLSLARDNDTLAGYQASRHDPKFVNFVDNTVNSRAGAHFGVDPSGSHCAQLIDGGSVSLSVSVAVPTTVNPRPVDPCAEALRIAQMIEPRLPQAPK
ncbi:MAG: DUF3558 family protein [Pseudonocardiaceae bacterium]